MYRVGLTGGIASGKSTVAAELRALGAPVVDADAISRALTAPGGEALPLIRQRFGEAVFDQDVLDRRALARMVFGDAEARAALDALLHPLIYARIEARCAELSAQGEPAAVLEIPLLFETGYDTQVDEIWVTTVPLAEQLRRLMRRDNLSEPEARARIGSQLPQQDKLSRAQVRIDTDAPLDQVRSQVRDAWRQTIRKAGGLHARTS